MKLLLQLLVPFYKLKQRLNNVEISQNPNGTNNLDDL